MTMAQEKKLTVDVKTPGTLSEVIGADNLSSVEDLTINGKINGTDINVLRAMLKLDEDYDNPVDYSLHSLDLTNAQIVEGGNPYYYDMYATKTDTITDYMFAYSEQLSSIKLPKTTKCIGWGAFNYCLGLTEIVIPDGVTTIESAAFQHCEALASVTMGDKVDSIGGFAFDECTSLESISLPAKISFIGEQAFYGCPALKTVSLINKDAATGDAGNNSIKTSARKADEEQSKQIQKLAFGDCTALEDATIPDNIEYLGSSAFSGCKTLKNVKLSDNLKIIDMFAFMNCTSLENINFPEELERINFQAFCYDASLKGVTIPNNVTLIDKSSFYGCTDVQKVEIGSGVTEIGNMAFEACDSLKAINVDNANTVYASIDGALTDKDMKVLIFVPGGHGADYDVPQSVETIAGDAFTANYTLKNVTLHDRVKTVGVSAFSKCHSLEKATLGSGVETIGEDAFYDCDKLAELHCRMPYPPSLSRDNVFYNVDKTTCKLYVPETAIDEYKNAYIWKDFTNIEAENTSSILNNFGVNGNKDSDLNGHIAVYDILGNIVYRGYGDNFNASKPGLCVIKMNGKTVKVVLK